MQWHFLWYSWPCFKACWQWVSDMNLFDRFLWLQITSGLDKCIPSYEVFSSPPSNLLTLCLLLLFFHFILCSVKLPAVCWPKENNDPKLKGTGKHIFLMHCIHWGFTAKGNTEIIMQHNIRQNICRKKTHCILILCKNPDKMQAIFIVEKLSTFQACTFMCAKYSLCLSSINKSQFTPTLSGCWHYFQICISHSFDTFNQSCQCSLIPDSFTSPSTFLCL